MPLAWTTDEVIALAKVAFDNAGDVGAEVSFDEELAFQLAAPEHRGRPNPTSAQLAVMRSIWDAYNEEVG